MPRLPVLAGSAVVRGLRRLGFEQIGQRGSHIKLRRGAATDIVPAHHEIRRGTLKSILDQAGMTIGDLLAGLAN